MRDHTGRKIVTGLGVFWIMWLLLKIICIPIVIVNIIGLIQAVQTDAVSTFDFTWLVLGLAGFVLL